MNKIASIRAQRPRSVARDLKITTDDASAQRAQHTVNNLEQALIGRSSGMRRLRQTVARIASANCRVWVSGPTGTGKALVTQTLHQLSGRKRRVRWTPKQSAFEWRRYRRDSIVQIDDIDRLSRKQQQRLIDALDSDWPVGLPLLCTSQTDLQLLCAEGQFEAALYHRIAELSIELPPLRERGRADILGIAKHVLAKRSPTLQFSRAALGSLAAHDWPGNVRELINLITRASLLCEGGSITPELLSLPATTGAQRRQLSEPPPSEPPPMAEEMASAALGNNESLVEYFQRFVLKHEANMSETELAKKLGISRKCLWERRQRFGIPRKNVSKRPEAR